MAIELTHLSDCGTARKSNQDSYCVRVAQTTGDGLVVLAVVCDGMGGLQFGEIASGTVTRAFGTWFDTRIGDLTGGLTPSVIANEWNLLIGTQHSRLLEYARRNQLQLGTTVSAALVTKGQYYILQIGDSRVYLDDTMQTSLLTQDQTLAMREYRAGNITREQFGVDPRRNILLQCVGNNTLNPVFQMGTVPPDGGLLVCSDGFYHFLSEPAVHSFLTTGGGRDGLENALLGYVSQARACGETDNITAVALRWKGFCSDTVSTQPLLMDAGRQDSAEILVKVDYSSSSLQL